MSKYNYKTLCVVATDALNEILSEAKASLVSSDYNFAAEVQLAERRRHDPSVVVRRALRDFWHNINSITLEQWSRYANLYQEHRGSDSLAQMHLRIEDSGEIHLIQIREFIEDNPAIYELMAVKEWRGIRIPSAMLVVAALAWEAERSV